jgi:hypothetical protein
MSTPSAPSLQAEIDRLRLQVEALQKDGSGEAISIGNYLLARLEQLKVTVSTLCSALIFYHMLLPGNVRRPGRLQSRLLGAH